jgi:hypothetical protein
MAASSSNWPVHQLWPPPEGNQRTELDVVLFHGLQLSANDSSDAWSSTWTQRGHDDVCWPREWLPFDLGEPVRIFSVSYNAHVVTSPHDHVSEIADNLFQTLINPRYKSPLFDYENTMLGPMKWFHLQIYEATKFFRYKICNLTIGSSLNCIENL